LKNPARDVFSPAASSQSLTAQVQALFAAGRVGGMWDMGDTSKLYQQYLLVGGNIATNVSQGVGIATALDQSKQSTFIDVTGVIWTKTSGDGVLTVSGNQVTVTGATTTTLITRTGGSIPTVKGACMMRVRANWTTATGVTFWSRAAPVVLSNGVPGTMCASLDNGSLERLDVGTGTVTFTIEEFKYWAGNHAFQPTAGLRPLYQLAGGYGCAQFDATDDALLFPAITFGGAFNTFVAGKVTGATRGIHIWRTADVAGGWWALYQTADALSPTGAGAGTPSYFINGSALSPVQRGQIYTQINNVDSVMESIGVTLTVETALQFSGYPAVPFVGNAHRVLMISGTLTAGEKLLCRQWCAQGNGVTVV